MLLLVTVAYKPIYDYREGGYEINHQQMNNDPTWHDCHREMVQTVPGIVLAYLETLVIAALSVAISTRLPAIANFLISFAIYVLGHLTPLLVQSQVVAQQLPPVVFFGRLIATVLPVLDHFNIQASVAAGVPVPLQYLAWSLVYCVLYSTRRHAAGADVVRRPRSGITLAGTKPGPGEREWTVNRDVTGSKFAQWHLL